MQPAYKGKRKRRDKSIYVVCVLVMAITVVFLVNSHSLQAKKAEYQVQLETLEAKLESEYDREAELEEYEKYTQTMKYIEEVAREKLGMVYEDEIIFKESK